MEKPSKIISFSELKTRKDVATILGISEKSLRYFLFKRRPENMYHTFTIPKKDGTLRTILAPQKELKSIQKKLCTILADAYNPKVCAYGFVPGKNHIMNAAQHTKSRLILNIDLKDFFTQIHFGRVRGLLMAPPYSIGEEAATTIAQLACCNKVLPQGAPSSPILTNMICTSLDNDMIKLARKNGCVYTRYADDLTLSTHSKAFSEDIVCSKNGNLQTGRKLNAILFKQNFEINPQKIELSVSTCHQEVTGLTVNSFPNLQRCYIKNLRAILHNCKKAGFYVTAQKYAQKGFCKNSKINQIISEPEKKKIVIEWFIKVLKGKIGYIKQVKGPESMTFLSLAKQMNDLCEHDVFDVSVLHKFEFLASNNVYVLLNENKTSYVQGSGFYLKDIGLVTSYHVVEDNAFYKVYRYNEFHNKSSGIVSLGAEVIKADKVLDYAIFPFVFHGDRSNMLEAGKSEELRVGDRVTIIGYPSFQDGDSPFIQCCEITSIKTFLSAPLYTVSGRIVHGASGGVVLNTENKVVGVIKGGVESIADSDSTDNQGFIPLHMILKTDSSSNL